MMIIYPSKLYSLQCSGLFVAVGAKPGFHRHTLQEQDMIRDDSDPLNAPGPVR